MIDASMLPDFIIEATEHLEELENSLLRLEEQHDDREVLDDIFRAMHNIKGASQFVGIDRVSELSHKLENLLDLIRVGDLQLDDKVFELLMDGKDRISVLVEELERTEAEESEVGDLIDKIKASIDGEPVEDVKDPVATDEPEELQADEEEPGDSGVAVEVAPLEGEDTDE
ncbi:MAG: Hpt domain-containing protein, partial [Thermodesulfobacteriota bacterium]